MNEVENLIEKQKFEKILQEQKLSSIQDRYFICAVICFCTGHPIAGLIFTFVHLILCVD